MSDGDLPSAGAGRHLPQAPCGASGPSLDTLALGGLAPFSTVDFPGTLAAVVFCQGCPWRCSYCHNAHLQAGPGQGPRWSSVLAWLASRRGMLDAVVFSGGEPTLQPGLPPAIAQARSLGFRVGLHTAGALPAMLRQILPLLDWVGLDIKGPRSAYDRITGQAGSAALAWQSLALLQASSVPFQLRTTMDPASLSPTDLEVLKREMEEAGAPPPVLQPCRAHRGRTAGISQGRG